MQFQDELAAGIILIRPALQSPDYVTGESGWAVKIDGTAEFSDLTIRSSDGSDSTVTIANGQVVIQDGTDAVVVEVDANGYRLFRSDGELVAEITLDSGGSFGGFYTRNFAFPENTYSFLAGGQVIFGPVDNSVSDIHGFLQYVIAPTVAQPYSVQTLSSGALDATLDDEARIQLISQRGERSKVWVDGGSGSIEADLIVTGTVTAANIRAGSASTPAPGVGGGTTTVAVVFSSPMSAVPTVTLDPRTTVDPATVDIKGYVDSVTASGFTIRAYRSTNSATTWAYQAIAPA